MNNSTYITREDLRSAIKAYNAERDPWTRGLIYKREFSPVLAKGGDIPIQAAGNSPGTMVGNLISQRVLELLKVNLIEITRLTCDFSAEQVKFGQTIYTRTIAVPTVGTYSASTGYPSSDANATDVPITINQHKCVQSTFTANDLSGTARRLFDEFAPAAAYALGKDLIDYVYALITAANFTATAIVADGTEFGRPTVIDVGTALSKAGVPLGSQFRTLLLNSDYYGNLAKDAAIITLSAFQDPAIIEQGQLPNVHGFAVVEAPNLPSTGNMTGFGMGKSALVAATRLPNDYATILPGASYGSVETVTNVDTGASCVQTMYADHKLGTANFRLAWMYGGSKGQIAAGQLLTSV